MKDIIFVEGNIIIESGNHQVKELIAYATDKWKNITEDDKISHGDLIITNKSALMPYTILCASGEISSYGDFISGMLRPNDVIRIYREEIDNLQKLRKQEINSELSYVLNRQIYISVVGTMELFLCDFLYSMVLGTRKYYNKFCENSSRTFKLKEISNNQWRIQDEVSRAIIETNYHRIKEVNNIYKKVLNLEFPSYRKLEKQILTRHSLVHRNGVPNKDSKYIEVNTKMIDELIMEVQKIVNHIIKTKENEIRKWFPDPTKNK